MSEDIYMDKLIMRFQIFADDAQVSSMEGPYGEVTIIPFTGKVESELFTGEILPGAADVQVENLAGSRNMCAKYMFLGKDGSGNTCHLFVENNGYFTKTNKNDKVFNAFPRFMTDCRILGAYLCQNRFRSEVEGKEWGVEIRIFDVLERG